MRPKGLFLFVATAVILAVFCFGIIEGSGVTEVAEITNKAEASSTPPVIWYTPHPDDETLSMGGHIYKHHQVGRQNIVVLLTKGEGTNAISDINDKLELEGYSTIGTTQLKNARVQEFNLAIDRLAVDQVYIYELPDGGVTKSAVYNIIQDMENTYPGASHKTMTYHDDHSDHAAAGEALLQFYNDGKTSDARFYIKRQQHGTVPGYGVSFNDGMRQAKRRALSAYKIWYPEEGFYSVGYISVPGSFDAQYDNPVERYHKPNE